MIPDTDEDLSWHAFLGHSIDMQGWRAAEFVGVDALTKEASGFVPLIDRGVGVRELGQLWEIPAIRDHLLHGTAGLPLSATLNVLRTEGGVVGESFSDAYEAFPWRKAHMAVRAYLQNSAALKLYDYSFRRWLEAECNELGMTEFPPPDFREKFSVQGGKASVEWTLVRRLEESFYQVGPTMAPYMICDCSSGSGMKARPTCLRRSSRTSFHIQFVAKYGRGIIPSDRSDFIAWWLGMYPEVPPRLVNECIWLAVETGLL